MIKQLVLAGTLLVVPTCYAQTNQVALAFPSQEVVQLDKTTNVQYLSFTATNLTDKPVAMLGYAASCGCTTVDSKGTIFAPNGTINFQVKLSKTKPASEYANIMDQFTNLYQVTFIVTNSPSK